MLTPNQKALTVEQEDAIIQKGNLAEQLLSDEKLDLFINQYKFEVVTELSSFSSHSEEINNKRIALVNYISGVDGFIDYLKKAITAKERMEVKKRGAVEP
jgi:hypothetical protein